MKIIWAIARNTILQAMRMRSALLIILMYILVTILLPQIIEADGTQIGEIKLLITYSLTFSMALLTALTILLSTGLLHTEIIDKHIFLLASKPINRWQILAGKFTGIMLLNLWLIIIMGSITCITAYYMARVDSNRSQEYLEIREKLLTSRISIRPPDFDINKVVDAMRKDLIMRGAKPEEVNSVSLRKMIERSVEKNQIRVSPLQAIGFFLSGIPQGKTPYENYTIKYKLYATDGAKVPLHSEWVLFNNETRAYTIKYTSSRSGDSREFSIPASIVSSKGNLGINYKNITIGKSENGEYNIANSHPVSFSLKEGLELLVHGGSFIVNFSKGLFMLFMRLCLITIIGIAASAYLHFPIAALLLLTFTFYGYGRTFIDTQLEKSISKNHKQQAAAYNKESSQDSVFTIIRKQVIYPFTRNTLRISPDFSYSDPTNDLIEGRSISNMKILRILFWDVLIRGGIAFFVGIYLIYKRELANPEG